MKKVWLFFGLIVVFTVQAALLSSFYTIYTNSYLTGSSAVVISKADYAFLRVQIDIVPEVNNGQSQTALLFPNGTKVRIPAVAHYVFSVVLPITQYSIGSFAFGGEGINISDSHPVDAEFVSNVTSDFFSMQAFYQGVTVYDFIVQGDAMVSVTGYGVGL